MTRARTLLIVSVVLAAALVALVEWRQTAFERERQQLEADRARLAGQTAELKLRRNLLREQRKLRESGDFYLVLQATADAEGRATGEGHLRLHDRALRRFSWTAMGRAPAAGTYTLKSAATEALVWDGGLVIEPSPEGEALPCGDEQTSCLRVSTDDFAPLARLKPGTVLLVLP